MAKESATVASTEDERDVQEVRCSVSGMPIPSIPLWYADVKVNFVSDAARSKSGATALRAAELVEEDEDDEEAEDAEGDISLEDVDEDVAADEVEMDLGDGVPEDVAE